MDEARLVGLSIVEAAALIKRRQLSPVELVEACLDRVKRLNPKLNAFLTVMERQALEQAHQAAKAMERGENWGPLHGIPIGIKDLIDVEGALTTAGSLFMRDQVAEDDADAVRRLKAAGAIIIGKTHLHEFAIGATNVNPHYGPARNPWNPELSPGGSSGGSGAAVAAWMCPAALGTDTGGSVRVPSALCGLTGLRPGVDRISTQGVIPMSWTLDTVGPMAHTAHEVALLFEVLATKPVVCVDRLNEPIRGLRIGLPSNDFFQLETSYETLSAVRQAVETLEDQGVQLVEVSIPQIEDVLHAAGVISLGDAAAYHQERLKTLPELFGPDVRVRLELGAKRSAADYALAVQVGRGWRQALRSLFRDRVDALALPTTPVPAPAIQDSDAIAAARELLRFTYPFSLSYLPALSLPCGFTSDGLPIGLQLVAPSETMLLQIAHAYQQVTDWHSRWPEV